VNVKPSQYANALIFPYNFINFFANISHDVGEVVLPVQVRKYLL
jgi:hypothetical protein